MFEFKDVLLGAVVALALSGPSWAADDNPWRIWPTPQTQAPPPSGNAWGGYGQPGLGMEYPPEDLERRLDSQVQQQIYPGRPVPPQPAPPAGAPPARDGGQVYPGTYPPAADPYVRPGLPAVNDIYGPHELDLYPRYGGYGGYGHYGGAGDLWPGIGYHGLPYHGYGYGTGWPYPGGTGLGWPFGLGWPGLAY